MEKNKIITGWGTDSLCDSQQAAKQGGDLVKMNRWFTNYEILKMATSDNAELLNLPGKKTHTQAKSGN